MGVLDFAAQQNAPTARSRTARDDRPKAKVWLNIGYQAGDKFITLPVGLPIDTMEPVEVRGQNEDWIKQQNARNGLLEMLQQAGASLEAGEEKTVNLTIQLRRTNEEVQVATVDNEYALNPDLLKSIVG